MHVKGPKGIGVRGPGFQVRAWHARREWMVSLPWGAVTVGGARGPGDQEPETQWRPAGDMPLVT